MNPSTRQRSDSAFTRTELAVTIVVVLFVVAGLLQVIASRMRENQVRQTCINNLKQIGLAFRIFASEGGGDGYPMAYSTNGHGSKEAILTGATFRHFQVLSNELGSPNVLACPADNRSSATGFGIVFSNTNLSYLVGVDADDTHPNMLLAGDRNITNGLAPVTGLLTLTPANPPGWDRPWHIGHGILGRADGSVLQMTTAQLQAHIAKNPETNRIALPQP